MKTSSTILTLLALGAINSSAALVWTVGNSDAAGRVNPPGSEINSIYGAAGSTAFYQENNSAADALPGSPTSPAGNQLQDDDFYFAGVYTNQVDGGAVYTTAGPVATTEANIERAVTGGDPRNRYHFNFAGTHAPTDNFTVTFGMIDLDDNSTGTGVYDFSIFVNGVAIGTVQHNQSTINMPLMSNSFTLGDVNGTAGANDDNYVELVANNSGSTSRWSNFDYVRLDVEPIPEPSSFGLLAIAAAGIAMIRRRRN